MRSCSPPTVAQTTSPTSPIFARLPTRFPMADLLKKVGMNRVKKLSFSRSGSRGFVVNSTPICAMLPKTETTTSIPTSGAVRMIMRMIDDVARVTTPCGDISRFGRSSRKCRRNRPSSS
jgi:hypothetical protein